MNSPASAYYHWPGLWVDSAPAWIQAPSLEDQDADVSVLADEVYREILAAGLRVRVLREGMFIFDFSEWEPGRPLHIDAEPDFDASASVALQRATLMNAHLACLHTAIAKVQNFSNRMMIVTPSEMISISSFEESWGGTGSDTRLSALTMSRFTSTYTPNLPPSFDWRLQFRSLAVKLETLQESFRLLNAIVDHDSEDMLDMVDLLARGCGSYQEHNYALCLVVEWTLCERLLQTIWQRYIEENRVREIEDMLTPFITKKRKEALGDSRNFSAAVVSEILSLTGQLPHDIYRRLTESRKARNDWVHRIVPVSREAALQSVRVAQDMLCLVSGIELEMPLNLSIHG